MPLIGVYGLFLNSVTILIITIMINLCEKGKEIVHEVEEREEEEEGKFEHEGGE
jgi:hypothetical protein